MPATTPKTARNLYAIETEYPSCAIDVQFLHAAGHRLRGRPLEVTRMEVRPEFSRDQASAGLALRNKSTVMPDDISWNRLAGAVEISAHELTRTTRSKASLIEPATVRANGAVRDLRWHCYFGHSDLT